MAGRKNPLQITSDLQRVFLPDGLTTIAMWEWFFPVLIMPLTCNYFAIGTSFTDSSGNNVCFTTVACCVYRLLAKIIWHDFEIVAQSPIQLNLIKYKRMIKSIIFQELRNYFQCNPPLIGPMLCTNLINYLIILFESLISFLPFNKWLNRDVILRLILA